MAMTTAQKDVATYVGGGLLVLAIVYLILKQLGSGITDFFTGEGPTSTVNEDNPLDVSAASLSFPVRQYDLWSDALYEAMNYTGTDWDVILSIFDKLKNIHDVSALVNAYGVRTLYVFGIPTAPLTLGQSLVRESSMSWNGVEDVNQILTQKGINLQFS
jgi:hypothetical protein